MKPSKIHSVLDLAVRINNVGGRFNPMFVGPPGIGKSEVVQQWCKMNGYQMIDFRGALVEAPDLIGFPFVTVVGGRQVTSHVTPDFWPTEGKGVLFIDEINRANTSVLNAFMQLLTDRKLHKYTLPKEWLIVSAINPEDSGNNDVTTMDDAFKSRFTMFNIDFDKNSFVDYMKKCEWDKSLVQFVDSGLWKYVRPEDIGKKPGDKYLASRDLSYLNNILKAGFDGDDERMLYESALGSNYALAFYKFKHDERPVTYKDLVDNEKASLAKLAVFSDPANCKNAQIAVTIQNIVEEKKVSDELLSKVVLTIPADQGYALLLSLKKANKDNKLLDRLMDTYPEVRIYFKDHLKSNK